MSAISARISRALIAAAFALPAGTATGQGFGDRAATAPYTSTLTYGTGLINIPVAWISPGTGDFFVATSARGIRDAGFTPKASGSRWDFTETVEAHFGGRLSIGASLYDPGSMQVGAFGQVLLVRQADGGPRWLPSIAIGARNIGSSKYQDRYVTGIERAADAVGGVTATTGAFDGSPTVFAVGTREFRWRGASGSFSLGYGNGLFKSDGGMGEDYNVRGTMVSGLFFGGRLVKPIGDATSLALLVDNDGFDFNVGGSIAFGGLTLTLAATELEEQKGIREDSSLANFTKLGVLVSYNASLPGMLRGSRQRAEAAEANLMARRLRQEVAQRRVLTERLSADLAAAARAADAATLAERQRLQRQLEAEQAALKAATERLEALTRKPPEGR